MFETIAVLLVFLLILGFGFGFYFFIAKAGAAREQFQFQQARAVENAQRLSTLPELDCTKQGVPTERCVDSLKAQLFTQALTDPEAQDFYFDTLGYSKFVLREVYPTRATYLLYDKKRAKDGGYSLTQVPVRFFNPINNTYSFGVIEVTSYD